MSKQFKTPGVYVQEKTSLPPSVGEVPSAIPAFVGYTERAIKNGSDVTNRPVHVSSMLEFHQVFGGPNTSEVPKVILDQSKKSVSSITFGNRYYLYASLQMFYANGGGECWVVSVGPYAQTEDDYEVKYDALSKGLNALREEQQPTMLVIPEAMLLSEQLASDLQKEMIAQSKEMMNRFAILDVYGGDKQTDWKEVIKNFRTKIGNNDLDYAAAYFPFIETSLPQNYGIADIQLDAGGSGFADLLGKDAQAEYKTADQIAQERTNLKQTLSKIDQGVPYSSFLSPAPELVYAPIFGKSKADMLAIAAEDFEGFEKTANALKDQWNSTISYFHRFSGTGNPVTLAVKEVKNWVGENGIVQAKAVKSEFQAQIENHPALKDFDTAWLPKFESLNGLFAQTELDALQMNLEYDKENQTVVISLGGAELSVDTSVKDALEAKYTELKVKLKDGDASLLAPLIPPADALYNAVGELRDYFLGLTSKLLSSFEKRLVALSPLVKQIVDQVHIAGATLPPCGAIAGVYTKVDNDRGVWKAPANISLNRTVRAVAKITDKTQENLNVDPLTGKSINAIRDFVGKGTLIWGARTLDGNSNEWRYVNVRRTFIMVEESLKLATGWAVFEPNDATTWSQVSAMISNYLTNLWKQGALVGSSPDQAFFVNIGLGSTMTPQDILEGYMKVEIGMAVARPAEFIVLAFSHKLQES